MMDEILKAKIDSYKIGQKELLKDIEFSLSKGEMLIVIGRNGAGKSTFLKHLTNEISHSASFIEVFQKPIKEFKEKELAQVRAILAQSTSLTFGYEVIEVVLLGRIPHNAKGNDSRKDYKIAKESLAKVGLSGYESRNYLTLSGGEQQRVHLARTLAQISETGKDRIFLLDEPTNSLDIAHQYSTLKLVKELSKEGVGTLAILHDLNLAAQFADKIIILHNGTIGAYGTPKEVLTKENILETFGHEVIVSNHPTIDCPLIISNFK